MKTGWAWALVAGVAFCACGAGGSLPPGATGKGDDPVEPVLPGEGTTSEGLWPLTEGSRWVYRISDDQRGVFEKSVEVVGREIVPGGSFETMHVRSQQPHLEEHSWQALAAGGLVVRLREEDLKDGAVVRTTTWDPANIKAVNEKVAADWTNSSVVQERTVFSDGSTENKERTYIWRVLATDVRVETPAGVFEDAIQLERTRPDKEDWVRIYWLVPGIGKVREEGERVEELLEYDIQ